MDFETTGIDTSTAQAVQLACVFVDARRLEVIPNSEFSTLIKPLYGEECAKAGLQELTDGAINIHKKDHALLAEQGVSLEVALSNFCSYVNSYNPSKQKWKSPVPAGYNINGYDLPILKRDCKRLNLTYPFHPVYTVDVLQLMFLFFENDKAVSSLSADSLIRKHMGYKDVGQSHDAMSDVIMTAELMIKSLRLIRKAVGTVKFEGCFV
jgi:DNA polymerase III epsilon subunit-like protein